MKAMIEVPCFMGPGGRVTVTVTWWDRAGIPSPYAPADEMTRAYAAGELVEVMQPARHPAQDTARGAMLAAIIGGTGLALYLAAFHLGVELTVVPESLPAVWWRIPVLLISAAHDGILEEIVVLAYLLRRLDQLGWTPWKAILLSAVLRGSYHLYQGFGAFVGNAVMGLVFGILYKRWGRCTPMIVAHTLIDAVTFVGYAALRGKVSWLP